MMQVTIYLPVKGLIFYPELLTEKITESFLSIFVAAGNLLPAADCRMLVTPQSGIFTAFRLVAGSERRTWNSELQTLNIEP